MALVLLHAFPLDSRMWGPQKSLNPITPEILGIGPINDAADHVARLLDQRGLDRAAIGGLSRGGIIALAFAAATPTALAPWCSATPPPAWMTNRPNEAATRWPTG